MIVNRRGGLPIASAVLLLLATVPAGAGRLRWTLLPGLPGEPVINSVAIDPQDAAILYAAVQQWPLQFTNRGGGVARSVDGGATWKPMSEGLSSEGVAFLKISGVDDHLLFAESGGGFYRSENSAATWTRLGAPIGNDSCRQILTYFCDTTLSVSALQRATVYAADQTGVFKSLDAGRTWVRLADPSPLATGALQIEADPSRAGILYARTFYSGTLYRSVDDGATWNAASPTIPNSIGAFWLDTNQPDVLYATSEVQNLLYRSADGGVSWESIDIGLSGVGGQVVGLAFPDGAPGTIDLATSDGAFHSPDDARSWSALSIAEPPPPGINFIATSPGGAGTIYVAQNGMLLKSTDAGEAFHDVPGIGLPSGTVVNAVAGMGETFSIGSDGGLSFCSTLRCSSPILSNVNVLAIAAIPSNPVAYCVSHFETNDRGMFETGVAIVESHDGGATYSVIADNHLRFDALDAIVVDPDDPGTIYAGALASQAIFPGVVKSTDGGLTWSASGLDGTEVTALGVDPFEPSRILAGSSSGAIERSDDGGSTWAAAADLSARVNTLLPDPQIAGRFFAATAQGAFESDDGGTTWEARNDGLVSTNVHALAFGPGNTLFAGSDRGVFEAPRAGGVWVRVGSGPSNPQVLGIASDGAGTVLAGTAGGGLFEYSFASVVPAEAHSAVVVTRPAPAR